MARKKKHRVPATGAVWHRSAEQATLDRMPKYNGHACKTGAHGDAKYNRAKQKRAWKRDIAWTETRNRGSLPCGAGSGRSPKALPDARRVHVLPNMLSPWGMHHVH